MCENGTGQQMTQLRANYIVMMTVNNNLLFLNIRPTCFGL